MPEKRERERCLDAAKDCICKNREDEYGSPEDNFRTIASFWSTYLSKSLGRTVVVTSRDVAIMMTLLKIARLSSGNFTGDSYIDACGYMACGYEIEMKCNELTNNYIKGE